MTGASRLARLSVSRFRLRRRLLLEVPRLKVQGNASGNRQSVAAALVSHSGFSLNRNRDWDVT